MDKAAEREEARRNMNWIANLTLLIGLLIVTGAGLYAAFTQGWPLWQPILITGVAVILWSLFFSAISTQLKNLKE